MVLTTTMVFAQTDGIELVLLNHTCTRGPSVTRMRDFFYTLGVSIKKILVGQNTMMMIFVNQI